MIRDALDAGAHVYDLRGITETLDSDDSHVGLIQFKVGTGGAGRRVRRRVGPAGQPAVYKAFELYLAGADDEVRDGRCTTSSTTVPAVTR